MNRFFALPVGLLLSLSAYSQTFTEQLGTNLPASTLINDVELGDYNLDGYLDVLVQAQDTTYIYKNNGDGTFSEVKKIVIDGMIQGKVSWGDLNGDNLLEAIVVGDTAMHAFRNDGDEKFKKKTSLKGGNNFEDLDWGDVDNDGDIELIVAGTKTRVQKNKGDFSFSKFSTNFKERTSSKLGDMNNDGILDLVLSSKDGSVESEIQLNNGDLSVFHQILLPVESHSLDLADFDADGLLDIVLAADDGGNDKIVVYRNNSDSTFTEVENISVINSTSVQWSDIDNDGLSDIIVFGVVDGVKIFINNGDFTFSELPGVSMESASNKGFAIGDVDRDGDLDIITISNGIHVYVNDGVTPNTAPTTPGGLSVTTNVETAYFSWSQGTDVETSPDGLNYNLYFYKKGAASKIAPSEAFDANDAGNGARLVRRKGSIQVNSNYPIKNLPTGIYYWSVQSVDAGFAGSAFAVEDSFEMVNLSVVNYSVSQGIMTNTSILLEYSQNSTNGTDGDWQVCAEDTTAIDFGTGGYDLYVREANNTSNVRWVGRINTPVAGPIFTIDFVNERTNEIVPAHIDYSMNMDMSSPSAGGDSTLAVNPGQNIYFRTMANDSTLASGIFELVVPLRPSAPSFTIDFFKERTSDLIADNYAYGLLTDLSDAITGPNDFISLTPGQDLYIQLKAGASNFSSPVQTLVVPTRESAPVFSIDFDKESTAEIIPASISYDVNADLSAANTGNDVKIAVTPGQNLYFATSPTGSSFKSEIFELIVANRPVAQDLTIDFANELTNEHVGPEYAYSVNTSMIDSTLGIGAVVTIVPAQNLYYQLLPTVTSFRSLVKELVVPDRPAAPSFSIDYINERTFESISDQVEYADNSNLNASTDGANATLSLTPGQDVYFRYKATSSVFSSEVQWLQVLARPSAPTFSIDYAGEHTNEVVGGLYGYSLNNDMSLGAIGSNSTVDVTPGQNLYFQLLATGNEFASEIQALVVPARPAAPQYSIDFVNETILEIVADTDEYSSAANFSNASSGVNAVISLIPGQNMYFRTKATGSSFISNVQELIVPGRANSGTITVDFEREETAEVIPTNYTYGFTSDLSDGISGTGDPITLSPGMNLFYKVNANASMFSSGILELVVPARPEAPFFSIDFFNERTQEFVNNAVEYSVNPDLSSSTEGLNDRLNLIPGQDLYFREKATVSSFKSKIFALEVGERPAAPTGPVVYATENYFGWSNSPGITRTDRYEYSLDSGGTWNVCASNPVYVGTEYLAIGQVQVRVSANDMGFSSEALQADAEYNVKEEPPVITGIGDLEEVEIDFYPNPVKSRLHIISSLPNFTAYLYSMDGLLIQQIEMESGTNELEVSDLPMGSYLLVFKTADGRKVTRRLIKN